MGVKLTVEGDWRSAGDRFRADQWPGVHSGTGFPCRQQAYDGLRAIYDWVVQLYREAADRLRDGDRTVKFPEGTFPPGLPFRSLREPTAWGSCLMSSR